MNFRTISAGPFVRAALAKLRAPDFLAAYVISAFAVLAHGLWLLNDVVPNEDWIMYYYLKEKQFAVVYTFCAWFNCHAGFVFYALLGSYPSPVLGARLTSFALLWSSALLIYLIGAKYTTVGRQESLLIALVSLTYPACMVLHLVTPMWYTFYLSTFILAAFVALWAETLRGVARRVVRVLALAVFFVSFSVGSLLVFYGGFLVIHFLHFRRANPPPLPWWQATRVYLRRRLDFVALPVVFWTARAAYAYCCPTNAGYNAVLLDRKQFVGQYKLFFVTIGHQLASMCAPGILAVSFVLALAGAGAWFLLVRPRGPRLGPGRDHLNLLAFGLLLLACATLPYVLVGKSPVGDTEDWFTRHALLLGYPMAVLTVAASGFLFRLLRLGPKGRVVLVVALIVSGSCVRIRHCLKYQAYGVRDWSLCAKMRRSGEARATHVFGVSAEPPGFYYTVKPDYCWPFFLRFVFGGNLDRYAFYEPPPKSWSGDKKYATAYADRVVSKVVTGFYGQGWFHSYRAPPRGAPQGTMIIEPGAITRDSNLALAYWYYKFLDRQGLADFLQRATNVTFVTKAAADGAVGPRAQLLDCEGVEAPSP